MPVSASAFSPRSWFRAPVRRVLARQLYFSGLESLWLVILIGIAVGAIIVSQLHFGIGQNGADALRLLAGLLLSELAPLLTALILIARSSSAMASELAAMLADPAAFGGAAGDAFDVVIPALPGFGYSDRPTRPYQVNAEDLFHALMTEHLGYPRYIASGTDIGADVATRLALKHPDSVMGIHISAVVDPPLTADSAPLSDAEKAYQATAARWEADEGAYEHLQSTRPQTLAFSLADSPAGLASWIVEKFYFWSDHSNDLLRTFSLDMLIDNLMIYWTTGTIGSPMRYYYDSYHLRPKLRASDHVNAPTAICMWPKDLVTAPKAWAERFYNVQQYTHQKHGGHFPGWEAPDEYAQDVRRFAKRLRDL